MRKLAIISGSILFGLFALFLVFGFGLSEGEKKASVYYQSGYDKGYAEAKKGLAETASSKPENTKDEKPSGAVEILSHSSHVEDTGTYVVNGEVQNKTGSTAQGVKIVATFYDSANKVVATGFSYAQIQDLAPDQKSPFEVNNYPNSQSTKQIARYELQVDYQ